ncbi:MAG: NAD-dependent epimerase/dehydratase family protein [Phycisphaerales bacterium]|jgi:nucleoside-diphosphate-sugar epimerase|nr:NAD-dependent epimerase/dehydratase family protein [Phycisphaerales bacterium]
MLERTILITGAAGEIGHGLINALSGREGVRLIAMDLREVPEPLQSKVDSVHVGDICDRAFIEHVISLHRVNEVIHLAALLSTSAERAPEQAHEVNVQGTFNILRTAAEHAQAYDDPIRFVFPSTIAIYGVDAREKNDLPPVREYQALRPITMYGANKLYCEAMGRYYGRYYRSITRGDRRPPIDFRCLRLPGIISAETVPVGGTSDYVPEMIHAAAKGVPCVCFVREDTRLPWMMMPECVEAILKLAEAPVLSRNVYNIAAFSATAGDFAKAVRQHFPNAELSFEPNEGRQALVDTWPGDVDCMRAREDWGFEPRWTLEEAMAEYIVPNIRARYGEAPAREGATS